jgi:hypothetical protein
MVKKQNDSWSHVCVMAQLASGDESQIISGTLGFDTLLISQIDLEICIDRFLDDVLGKVSDSINNSRQQ